MGIRGLFSLIKRMAPNAVRERRFSEYKGIKIAVDASLLIHKTVIALRSAGRELTNLEGGLTSHLQGILYKTIRFLENGIIPVYVFDGRPPRIKMSTLQKRALEHQSQDREDREDCEDREGREDSEGHQNRRGRQRSQSRQNRRHYVLTRQDVHEAQKLLELLGVPYLMAPGEADVLCAWMASRYDSFDHPYVKGVCSDDSDMLVFGAHKLYKGMLSGMNKNGIVQEISLHRILIELNLTQNEFIDMCVLMGSDYCKNPTGIGPFTAYKLVQKYRNLDRIIRSKHIDDETAQCLREASLHYKTALQSLDRDPNFFVDPQRLRMGPPDMEGLIKFFCEKHHFEQNRIVKALDRLQKTLGRDVSVK
jgi:flap endonuclease-1